MKRKGLPVPSRAGRRPWWRGVRGPAPVAVGLLLASCAETAPPIGVEPPTLTVAIQPGKMLAPATARPGWVRLRVSEDSTPHIVVAFRLPATASDADLAAFRAAVDTTPITPSPGVAIGGAEIGAQGDVIVQMIPGRYLLACLTRGEDGHRHLQAGEFAILTIPPATVADSSVIAPRATQVIGLVDFAYVGPEQWTAGEQLVRVENTGTQDHQLRLVRLREGASLQTWMAAENPDSVGTVVAGMARVGPGEAAYLPVDLTPGDYVAYCLVADRATGRPHIMLGMLRSIQVR